MSTRRTYKREKLAKWRELGLPRSVEKMTAHHPSIPDGNREVNSVGPVLRSMWVNTVGAELYDEGDGIYLLVVEPDDWENTLAFSIVLRREACQ